MCGPKISVGLVSDRNIALLTNNQTLLNIGNWKAAAMVVNVGAVQDSAFGS